MKKKTIHPVKQISIAILLGSFTIAISILIYTLVTFVSSQNKIDTDPQEVYENIGYVTIENSPILGKKDAPVTVVEYTDFDCPICKLASDKVMPGFKKEYIETGKVKFVFKSLPIQSTHVNSFHKTEAAYCARELGGDEAFFAYYDSLFADFGFSLTLDDRLVSLAQTNGLDGDRFRTCLTSRKYTRVIEDDILEGNLIGSLGTPTWLIGKTDGNGLKDTVKVNGLISYENFQRIINRQLK